MPLPFWGDPCLLSNSLNCTPSLYIHIPFHKYFGFCLVPTSWRSKSQILQDMPRWYIDSYGGLQSDSSNDSKQIRSDSIVHGHANPALNSLNVNEVSRTLPVSPRDSDWFCPISFNYHSHGHFKPFWSIACSLRIATTSSCVQKTSCVLDWLKPLQIPHSRTATIFGSGARMLRALQTSS